MAKRINMSICTYNDGLFQVMITDKDTGEEIHFEGNRKFDESEFNMINDIAPACVWTTYERVDSE